MKMIITQRRKSKNDFFFLEFNRNIFILCISLCNYILLNISAYCEYFQLYPFLYCRAVSNRIGRGRGADLFLPILKIYARALIYKDEIRMQNQKNICII